MQNNSPLPPLFQGAGERLQVLFPLLWVYALVVVISFGTEMFSLTVTGDDWNALIYDHHQDRWVVSIGRWLQMVVWQLTDDANPAPALSLAILAAAYLATAVVLSEMLFITNRVATLILAATLVTFPINTETFSFQLAHFHIAVGMLCAMVGAATTVLAHEAWLRNHRRKAMLLAVAGALGLALACADYQLLAGFWASAILARALGHVLYEPWTSSVRRSLSNLLIFALICGICGIALYAISVRVVAFALDIPLMDSGRYAVTNALVSSWGEFSRIWTRSCTAFLNTLFFGQYGYPYAAKLLFLTAVAYLVVESLWRNRGRRDRGAPMESILLLLIVTAMVAIVFILIMPLKNGFLRYNNMTALAIPHAVVFALLYIRPKGRWLQMTVVAALTLSLCAFSYVQNRASMAGMLNNQRDMAILNRLLERITSNPDFPALSQRGPVKLIVYRTPKFLRLLPRPFMADAPRVGLYFNASVVDCGIFSCNVQHIHEAIKLIKESRVSFQMSQWPNRLDEPLPPGISPDEAARLDARLKSMPTWPLSGSVVFEKDYVLVAVGGEDVPVIKGTAPQP